MYVTQCTWCRYVRDTLEHNPDTMFQLRLDEVQVFNRSVRRSPLLAALTSRFQKNSEPSVTTFNLRMGVESKRRLSFPSRLADIRSLSVPH